MNEQPWLCPRGESCGARRDRHDDATGYFYGCRSGAAGHDHYRYAKSLRTGTHTPRLVPALGVQRRVRALRALGWTQQAISREAGRSSKALSRLLAAERVHIDVHRDYAVAYDRLCMTVGPSDRARVQARRDGCLPPLAYDDIDDPDETPDLGPRSPRSLGIDPGRVAELTAHGRTAAEIAEALGCSERAVVRVRARNRRDGEGEAA